MMITKVHESDHGQAVYIYKFLSYLVLINALLLMIQARKLTELANDKPP
jgi:hypothetical protein